MGSVEDFDEFFKNYVKKYSTTPLNTSGSLLSVISTHRANASLKNRNAINSSVPSYAPTNLSHTATTTVSIGCSPSITSTSNNSMQSAIPTIVKTTTISNGSANLQLPKGNSTVGVVATSKSLKRPITHGTSTQPPQKKKELDGGVSTVPNLLITTPTKLALNKTTQRLQNVIPLPTPPQQSTIVTNPVTVPRSKSVVVPTAKPIKGTSLLKPATLYLPKPVKVSASKSGAVSASKTATAFTPSTVTASSSNTAKVLASNSATVTLSNSTPHAAISTANLAPTLPPLMFQPFPALPINTTQILIGSALQSNIPASVFPRPLTQTFQSSSVVGFPPPITGPIKAPLQNHLPFTSTNQFQSSPPFQIYLPPNPTDPAFKYVTKDAYEVLKLICPPEYADFLLQAGFFEAEKLDRCRPEYENVLQYILNGQAHQGFRVERERVSILKITRPPTPRTIFPTSTVTSALPLQNSEVMTPTNPLKMMLWHGTRPKNVISILRNGFRCPQTGTQMFGKGIYFADRISKSAQYCNPTVFCTIPKPGEIGYLFLCEVTLGKCYNAKNVKDSNRKAPIATRHDGSSMTFDSLKCTGKNIPDRRQQKEIDGIIWPLGPTIKNTRFPSYSVLYNEFVVYHPEMVNIKYLVKVQFK